MGFLILLLSSFIIRLFLIANPSFKFDLDLIKTWTERILTTPFHSFYDPNVFIDYPPFFFYFLFIIGKIFTLFFSPNQIHSQQFEMFYKFILVLFDFLSALMIYKISLKYLNFKLALAASLIYLLNPVILFDAALWGQNDGVLIFLLLLSSYFLFEKKMLNVWAISFTLSFLFKFQAIAALPVMLVFLSKNFNLKNTTLAFLTAVLTTVIVTFPFFQSFLPIKDLFNMAQHSSSVYPYTSLNAFNLWALDGFWKSDSRIFYIVNLQTIGVFVFTSLLTIILARLVLEKKPFNLSYYLAISLSFLAFFLFLTRMHERYIVPFFGFFIFLSLFSKKDLALYILISIVSLLNLFYVYFYYNFVYIDSKNANNLTYQLIDGNYIWLSLINVLVFVYLLLKFVAIKKNV